MHETKLWKLGDLSASQIKLYYMNITASYYAT